MYLHHLSLQAIGPFAGRVDVDFASLGASGVFLLEGPTGAGKSTVIDAVVFALYGGLAGQDASRDRLHSQHAAADVEPFVDLVFETGAGIHRVRRTPQFERPKLRGGGTTKQNQSATLWRLSTPEDTVGTPLSDRAQDVGAEITRIVGLDRAQFVQTVVLPQGEFARFLQSPGEERRELLQSLFGTEIYERTADELAAARRAAAASVDRADAAVRDALSRFAEASGADDVDPADAAGIADELDVAAGRAADERTTRAAASSAATARVDDAVRRTLALTRRREFTARDDALTATTADVMATRERLEVAGRAGQVVALLDGLDAARDRLARRRDEHRTVCAGAAGVLERVAAHAGVPVAAAVLVGGTAGADGGAGAGAGESGDADADADADFLRARIAELRDAVAGAGHLVDVEAAAPARRRRLEQLADGVAVIRARRADVRDHVEIRPAERVVLVQTHRDAEHAAADRAEADRALADATALAELVVARATAEQDRTRADELLAAASSRARQAIAHESDLRARRVAGLAGELAATLADDAPCPVCGALEHPHPATMTDEHPDADAIDAATADRSDAESAQQTAAVAAGVATREHLRLVEATGGAPDADVLAAMEAATARIDAADAGARAAVAAEQALAAFDVATRELEHELTELTARVAADETAHDAAVRADEQDLLAVGDRLRELVALRGADGARGGADERPLADVVGALDADADALAAVVDAAQALAAADADARARAVEMTDALAASGFPDADAVRRAVLDPAEQAAARRAVAEHDAERAVVDAALAETEVVAAATDDDSSIALDAARTALDIAAAELDAATRVAATASSRATSARARLADLDRTLAAREDVSAEGRAVVRLAGIANGAPDVNPTGITLGTYVLMRRFEDVVAAANSRLGAMVGGRYSLEASADKESSSRARKVGLALAVRDHETGRTRDPRSLSGGETFYASLCLALGLADIVQAEAGGVELGTLFVDEGFGTLDPETLDGVLGQLTNLTAGGRQVGIVSHVEELKQRIADRIEVRRLPSGGSTLRTTT